TCSSLLDASSQAIRRSLGTANAFLGGSPGLRISNDLGCPDRASENRQCRVYRYDWTIRALPRRGRPHRRLHENRLVTCRMRTCRVPCRIWDSRSAWSTRRQPTCIRVREPPSSQPSTLRISGPGATWRRPKGQIACKPWLSRHILLCNITFRSCVTNELL